MEESNRSARPTRNRSKLLRLALVGLSVGFVALNALAWFHARAMTRFLPPAPGLERTRGPEELGFLERLRVLATGVRLPKTPNSETPLDRGLAFRTVELRSADGLRLQAWDVPAPAADGDAENAASGSTGARRGRVVLVHGYLGRKEHLLDELAWFHQRGFSTLAVDLRGAGDSEGMVTTLGEREALDVAAAVRWAREEAPVAGPLVLFGQSMGAAAILHAVAEHDVRADALVLESPFATLLETVEKRFHLMGLPSFPGARLLLFWGGVQLEFDALAVRPETWARSVRTPTLLLHGAHDVRVLEKEAFRVAAAMGGAADLELFDAGHAPLLDQVPEAWAAAVEVFLERL